MKDPNILLSCSNYKSKFNFIGIKKFRVVPTNFLKVNKYKFLNYYIIKGNAPPLAAGVRIVIERNNHCIVLSSV